MAVKFLASKRLTALSTDLVTVTPQGYAGANGASNIAGGGGGASAAGSSKNGGNGKASSITGSSVTYAGGGAGSADGSGAGGTGGTGGGGNGGSNNQNSTGGTDGLGGGAGGGGNQGTNDGTGGSGVVILRFTTSGTTYSTSGSPNVDTSTVSGKTILKYLSSGTFVLSGGTPDVEYLVVAGGGGSMTNWGHSGGAGAGGMIEGTKSSMSNATYTVTVGAGGVGSTSAPLQGGNSVFSDVTATGGGYGGNWVSGSTNNGGDGGSGGGAQSGSYTGGSGATYSTPKLGTTTATANVTDDLTTDKGWSSNSSDWAYNTSDYLYFNPIRRNTTSQDMYIDLQDSDYLGSGNNLHASKWVVRLGKFETVSLAGGNADFYFGVSDGTGDDSSTQQSVYFALNGNSSDAQISGAATTGNMNGSGRTYGSFSPTITNSASNELWLEMIRDSDNYTLNYYSDEYSTLASTATIAKSGISNLRYIKFTNDSEATSSYTWVAKLHGAIKIYNGITAVTSDSAVNAQTNTIAEETDTGIHRIWSGSAWVEVA